MAEPRPQYMNECDTVEYIVGRMHKRYDELLQRHLFEGKQPLTPAEKAEANYINGMLQTVRRIIDGENHA